MTPKGGIMPHSRYRVKAKRSEVLFVDYIAEHLNPTGRAAIIVPEGIVFQSANAYKELRKYLVDDGLLYAVISLPAGVFNPYSGVKTSILLIDKCFARLKDEILFVKLNNDGFDLGAQRREIKENDIPEIIHIVKKYHTDLEPQTADDEIRQHPLVTIASKEEVAARDYILVGERYKNCEFSNATFPMVQLDSICQTASGGTPNSSTREYYENGTINWLKSGEVRQGLIYSAEQKITELGLKNSSAKIFPVDTVLVAMYGATAGQVGLLKVGSATNQAICGILPSDRILPKFLFYLLKGKKEFLITQSTGGAQPNISQKIIRNLQIPLPSLSIQENIVAELDGYQKIIDGAQQVVENYKSAIQGSSLWNRVKVGDVVEFISGVTLSVGECEDINGIPLITIADVTEDGYIKADGIRKVVTDKKVNYLQKGDLLFNWRNGSKNLVGKTALFNLDGDYIFASFLLGVRPDTQKILSEFLWIVLNQYRVEGRYMQFMRQNVNGLFNREELKDVEIPCPPLDVQKKIVDGIFNEIRLVHQNKQLISIFEGKIKNKLSEVWGE